MKNCFLVCLPRFPIAISHGELIQVGKQRGCAEAGGADRRGPAPAGEMRVTIGGVYPPPEAARAPEDRIARRTSGKLLLDPTPGAAK